jgi:GNAT superfamily N-acetyltransferase
VADVSARVAWASDAEAIARVQVAAWRSSYADVVAPSVLDALDPTVFAQSWSDALAKPGDARSRVLVALERNRVKGFAITGPATDPDADPVADGMVDEFTIDPDSTRVGHGSRLIQACIDTLRADRFSRATCWIRTTDDAFRTFLESAGWAPDGATRELEAETGERVRQVRLHTSLSPDQD